MNVVKVIIALNLTICWVVLASFVTLVQSHTDLKKGAFTDNFNTFVAKYVWVLTMYLLAAFLIIGLVKIKKVLPKSEFKTKAMTLHILALLLQFCLQWIAEITIFLFKKVVVKDCISVVAYAMQSIVYFIECYIFI